MFTAYEDYADLWKSILDVPSDGPWNIGLELLPSALEKMQSELYESFIDNICTIINSLNLTLRGKVDDTSSETVNTSLLIPVVPKDFTLFVNLVCLSQLVLPTTRPDRLIRWSYTWAQELTEMSSKHPLVSGFQKLIHIIMNACKTFGLFEENVKSQDDIVK